MNPNRLKRLFDACEELRPLGLRPLDDGLFAIERRGEGGFSMTVEAEVAHALIECHILEWLTMRLAEMGCSLMVHHIAGRFWLMSHMTPGFASASLPEACVCAAEWVKGLELWAE